MKFLTAVLIFAVAISLTISKPHWRVRYGDLARLGQFPYIVLIYSGATICTASIVGDNKVLTAGHCVCGQNKMRDVYTETISTDKGVDGSKKYDVASWNSHPDYAGECSKLGRGMSGVGVTGSDIAMITIRGKFRYSTTVKSVQISNQKPKSGKRVTIAGFGKDENGKTGTMKFGSVVLKDCDSFEYSERANCYNADESVNRQATGSGDSGGPMLFNGQVVGVTSGKITWSNGIQLGVHASTAGNYDYVKKALRQ